MQHYGCPTRLVDFTEVPLVALFHALGDGKETKKAFSVYAIARDHVLGVEYWNDLYQDNPGKISDRSEDLNYDLNNVRRIANWLIDPRSNKQPDDDTHAQLLCVYPTFANRRLEAQSGLFLMQRRLGGSFENDLQSVLTCRKKEACALSQFKENLADKAYCESLRTVKFVSPKSLRARARTLLHVAGINQKAMFPDFEGIAEQVKEACFMSDNDDRIESVEHHPRPSICLSQKLPESGE